ncbi:KUP system potassium uptake protein [Stigmatella aurantiaca]|uniref:KUP system potassium uptake protein n=1 Tax=Stigmatella aurantiaca TaxID=41 RepID=A0A1H7XUU3_STIAU|nr:KUP system potassium uptake protein [Stigmatella aurantiaca]
MLSHLSQGAWLLHHPETADAPFFRSLPSGALYPMVALATVVASQALISAVFALTRQAIQLGYCPPLRIVHTSPGHRGQIYLPGVNGGLMLACVAVVLGFRSSGALAAAYGVAVAGTMAITTVLFAAVVTYYVGWVNVRAQRGGGMPRGLKRLYGVMQRNAYHTPDYFRLPSGQVMELGARVEL